MNDNVSLINDAEAEKIIWLFEHLLDYAYNPPIDLVKDVQEEYNNQFSDTEKKIKHLSDKEACERITYSQIIEYLVNEFNQEFKESINDSYWREIERVIKIIQNPVKL